MLRIVYKWEWSQAATDLVTPEWMQVVSAYMEQAFTVQVH